MLMSMHSRLAPNKALSKLVTLGSSDTLRVLLTVKADNKPLRPHQAFLLVKDSSSNLETSFDFSVKESGKAKVELVSLRSPEMQWQLLICAIKSHKDIPAQLVTSSSPLTASIVIASFGSSKPYESKAFDFKIDVDPNFPIAAPEKPLRYGKLPEIHHIFKTDPTSPSKIITLVFSAAVIAALPVLLFMVCNSVCRVWVATNRSTSVACSWGEPQPRIKSIRKLSNLAYCILYFYHSHGGPLLPVLHFMEVVSDTACSSCHRINDLLEWKQSIERGSSAEASRFEMKFSLKYELCKECWLTR